MKIYITKDRVNLYDVFRAGVLFGTTHRESSYTEAEWYAALESALGADYVASLETVEEMTARQGR